MVLDWEHVQVCFVRGGGGMWQRATDSLDSAWFARHLVDYDLWYISHGEASLRDEAGQVTTLHAGDCVLMRPGTRFDVWRCPSTKFGNRYFHFLLLDAQGKPIGPQRLSDIPLISRLAHLPHLDAVTRRMTDLITFDPLVTSDSARAGTRQILSSLLKALLAELVVASRVREANRLEGIDEDHFKIALHLAARIRENPGHFDLDAYIARNGYSTDHFRRIVKRAIGQTPHQILIAARIDRARQLMRQTELSISDIAEMLGYANVQYFSLQFKQITGMTPSAYREARETVI